MKSEIEKFVGKKAIITVGGLAVQVTIKDVKQAYGKDRYLVSPVAGSGEIWTEKVSLAK